MPRQAGAEEITREMLRGGVDELLSFDADDLRYSEPEVVVRSIYRAMRELAGQPPDRGGV